ncbi:MAG: GIY-YIG nuclease family protein [Candidatus Heimdallarchaeota archaeon]|nr:MAG: GIY-YIG nuclease family protein [Candidatus Heimdallarchaeota archaeon]
MPYWVYMLFVGDPSHGSNRKIYTGYTNHLMTRLIQHSGLTSTKGARITRKQPIELVYLEKFTSQKKAIQREFQLKHESPFNQKKHKLNLIKEFKVEHGQIFKEINNLLAEHFKFLANTAKTLENCEKKLMNEIEPQN